MFPIFKPSLPRSLLPIPLSLSLSKWGSHTTFIEKALQLSLVGCFHPKRNDVKKASSGGHRNLGMFLNYLARTFPRATSSSPSPLKHPFLKRQEIKTVASRVLLSPFVGGTRKYGCR
ncbi:hypothetical protein AMTR_s00133p00048950 [Amborella trichopoda]|uniref:Uncharacterized protein n=1 Tax=Amborella trichopoda TaxID=13333 RepID=W1P9Q1_AMBTC|nr:hypothetical protein AMTR_s00133p00048950 [Amborella trichopoda]